MSDINKIISSNNRFFNVKIGEIVVVEAPAILKTTLGSCVAVILYDKINKVGSMIHVMFPDSKGEKVEQPGKYADTGIPILLNKTLKAGASKNNIIAFIVGGNYLTEPKEEGKISFDVGKSNLEAVRIALNKEKLTYTEHDIQRNTGTIAMFDVSSGELRVKFLEKFQKSELTFNKTDTISDDEFSNMAKKIVVKGLSSINKSLKPSLTSDSYSYDSAVSINIFGSVKGKIILYANKKFIYSILTFGKINSEPTEDMDYIPILKLSADKFLKPIAKHLALYFAEKHIKVRFTEPTVFTLTKFLNLEFNYPESYTIVFKIGTNTIKINLTLGKIG